MLSVKEFMKQESNNKKDTVKNVSIGVVIGAAIATVVNMFT